MKIEEPPPAFRASVLAAARERVVDRDRASKPEAREPARPPAKEVEREEAGLWAAIVRWLGGFAMGPQVAMATMLLLMVGIGLWYLPELREHDPTNDSAILDPTDEVGPSARLEPAEPLDLEADPRTGRMVRTADRAEEQRPRAEPRQELSPEVATANEAARRDRPQPDPQVIDEPIEELMDAEADIAPGEALAGERAEVPRPQPAQPPPSQLALPQQGEQPTVLDAVDDDRAEGSAQNDSSQARYRRGMERYEARDYRGAADEFDAVVRRPDTDATRLLPSALHQLARSHRAAGDCRRAVPAYEQLLSRHPRYGSASDARVELGECYTRTGRLSDARRVLEDASRDPRVASRAQVELRRLETAERARGAVELEADDVEAAEP